MTKTIWENTGNKKAKQISGKLLVYQIYKLHIFPKQFHGGLALAILI